jgi:lipopolysaccharide/colanic/teichoic acid biosynthesis glycosyltransferase
MTRDPQRRFDLLAALLGWFCISPLLGLLALLVKIESPGPVLFRQRRIGADGRPFTLYKFRTMREPTAASSNGTSDFGEVDFERFVFTPDQPDPRVTPIGRVLRRTSLDEMPQLINVIRGEMSIVGPRPEIPELVRLYPPAFHARHRVRPGITGVAQIRGRSDLTYGETIRYDLAYIRCRSLRNDIAILARTLAVVLRGTGAR